MAVYYYLFQAFKGLPDVAPSYSLDLWISFAAFGVFQAAAIFYYLQSRKHLPLIESLGPAVASILLLAPEAVGFIITLLLYPLTILVVLIFLLVHFLRRGSKSRAKIQQK